MLCGGVWVNSLNCSGLVYGENKNVKIFAKILQKNLEIKKMSVSLQPI
jgi:hypothetical protein